MTKKKFLFDLVHSLTRHEKKHFRMQAGMRCGEKKYMRLFDEIEKQRQYDEKKLRGKLKGEKFLNQLPVAKNYLVESILKALRSFHSGKSLDHELREELRNVELLYAKGLYEQCMTLTVRMYHKARENEKHARLLEVLGWQRKLKRVMGYGSLSLNELEKREKLEKEVLDRIRNLHDYDIASDRYFLLSSKKNDLPFASEMKTFSKSRLLTDESLPSSYQAKFFFYLINSRIHHNLGDLKKSYGYGKKQIDLIEHLPHRLFSEEKYNYIISLYNQLIILTYLKKWNDFEKTLRKLRQVPLENDKERVTVFYSFLTELDYLIAVRHYSKALELEKNINAGLNDFSGKINTQVELAFFYNLTYAFIGAGQFKRALRWVNRLLNFPQLDIRTDIYCMARLLNLIIHYELGNGELLLGLAHSTTRYLKKREFFGDAEEVLLHYFGKFFPGLFTVTEKKKVFGKLLSEFDILSRQPANKNLVALFDFQCWVQSKITNVTMENFRSRTHT